MEQHLGNSSQEVQSRLAATADPQLSSPFFSVLPPEVRRMIYVEVWRHNRRHKEEEAREPSGEGTLKYHIINQKSGTSARYTHSPCVVADQNGHDIRMEGLDASGQQNLENDTWTRRIETDWAVHWPCEEIYKNAFRRRRSPFMSALLTCKLVYLECVEPIYSALTFVFTDTITAEAFISAHPPSIFRSIELCIRVPLILPELYYPPQFQSGPRPSLPNNLPLDALNNPWARLCNALIRCTALRQLNIWFDIKHLRGWKQRVWERRFFEALSDVRVPRESFTLALPELRPGKKSLVAEAYLEGECLAGLPYVVKRGPRPDYWESHLARVRARTPLLTIEAGPGHGAGA